MNWTGVCRGCMKITLNEMFKEPQAIEMFYYCINKEFSDADELPKQFCYDCYEKIESSFSFITHAQKVEIKLKKLLDLSKSGVVFNSKRLYSSVSCDLVKKSKRTLENAVKELKDENTIKKEALIAKGDNDQYIEVSVGPAESLNYDFFSQSDSKRDVEEKGQNVTLNRQHILALATNKYVCPICTTRFGSQLLLANHKKEHAGANTSTWSAQNYTEQPCSRAHLYKKPENENEFLASGGLNNKHERDKGNNVTNETWDDQPMFSRSDSESEEEDKVQNRTLNEEHILALARSKYVCTICSTRFGSQLWLANHMKENHTTLNTSSKGDLKPSSLKAQTLKKYRDSHNIDNKERGKQFKVRRLSNRFMIKHIDKKPSACHLCSRVFAKPSTLRAHFRRHHDPDRVIEQFLCSVCGTSLLSKTSLRSHMWSHTGESPYKCTFAGCARAFRNASNRLKHERTHAPREIWYTCDICQKGFTSKASLVRHIRTHTGERPFQCPCCERCFIDHGKRRRHLMRAHHMERQDIPRLPPARTPLPRPKSEPDGAGALPAPTPNVYAKS